MVSFLLFIFNIRTRSECHPERHRVPCREIVPKTPCSCLCHVRFLFLRDRDVPPPRAGYNLKCFLFQRDTNDNPAGFVLLGLQRKRHSFVAHRCRQTNAPPVPCWSNNGLGLLKTVRKPQRGRERPSTLLTTLAHSVPKSREERGKREKNGYFRVIRITPRQGGGGGSS